MHTALVEKNTKHYMVFITLLTGIHVCLQVRHAMNKKVSVQTTPAGRMVPVLRRQGQRTHVYALLLSRVSLTKVALSTFTFKNCD